MANTLPAGRALQVSMGRGWDEVLITIDRAGAYWEFRATGFSNTAHGTRVGGSTGGKHHTLEQAKRHARDHWRALRAKGFQTAYTLTA